MRAPYNVAAHPDSGYLNTGTPQKIKRAQRFHFLKAFEGAILVVSHDREFLDGLVSKVYEFGNQRVVEHLGGIYDFLEHKKLESLRELELSAPSTSKAGVPQPDAPQSDGKLSYEARKEQARAIKRAERAVAESEARIEELESSIAALEARLATPEGAADTSLYTQYADLKKELSDVMDRWTEQTLELEELRN